LRIGIVHPHTVLGAGAPPDHALAVLMRESSRRLAATDDVTVFCRRGRGQGAEEVLDGVRLRRFHALPDQIVGQLHRLDGRLLRDPELPFRTTGAYYAWFRRGVVRELHDARFDVVHVHVVPNFLPAFREAAPGARIVFHAHDHHVASFDADRMGAFLSAADVIYACSRFVAGEIAARHPRLADRCEVLYNGVDAAFLEEAPRPRAGGAGVLFVGRLSPEKGVHDLIDAFCSVAGRHPDATLHLVGPDDLAPLQFVDPFGRDPRFDALRAYYGDARSYAAALRERVPPPLRERVRFLGTVPNRELPALYRDADVFAFPSVWDEPFGMPVIEAMATGLPVVATRVGALPETVLDGETGALVEAGDVPSLAAALDDLLGSPARRREWGAAGRRRVAETFSWDALVADRRRRYLRLCGHPARMDTIAAADGRETSPPRPSSRPEDA